MATNEIKIGLRGVMATTFDSGPPTLITLSDWQEYPLMSPITQSTVNGYSFDGSGIVEGPAHTTKYTWGFEINLDSLLANDLYTLWQWQQDNDLPLRMTDEVNFLPARPAATPVRPLVQTFTKSYGSPAWTYGYGAFDVWLNLPNNWNQFFGNRSSSGQQRLVNFTVVEA
jgi:hypothetical protein